jgi:para-nitrobenzyl esterase
MIVQAGEASATAKDRPAAPQVTTRQGEIVGRFADPDRRIMAFKGIAYAMPPVGSRRWRAAQPVPDWKEPLLADRFGPDCMQSSTMDVVARPQADFWYHAPSLPSEDCLYLNVWAPADAVAAKRPVMVWIHGGGEVQGSGSWPLYDGTNLARKGAVIVTLNYRLGIFGRFALPALSSESGGRGSGTYDMSDLVEALRWVRDNIGAFGGDPENVTIFGQSSGAMYVAALMVSPPARGLFHKAIGQSGFAFFDPMLTREGAEARGAGFAISIGKPALADLRDVPASELIARSRSAGFAMTLPLDGYYVPDHPCAIFHKGQQARVPLLTGYTADEQFGWLPPPIRITRFSAFDAAARKLFSYYGGPGLAANFLSLVPRARWHPEMAEPLLRRYGMTGWQTESWADAMSRVVPDVYFYRFDQPPNGAETAFHTAELSFMFDNERDAPRYSPNMPALRPRAADLALADRMSDYWVSFAKTGSPASAGGASWPRYGGSARRRIMIFRGDGGQPASDFFPDMAFQNLCALGRSELDDPK